MTSNQFRSADVPVEVRRLLGDRASDWMLTPNRLFDNLAPCDLMHSPEGVQVVLFEFERSVGTHGAQLESRRR